MTPEEQNQIEKIISNLEGTINSLQSVCEDVGLSGDDDLTQEQLEYLDNEIFCCANCGWWHQQPSKNSNDEQVCEDCYEEGKE